MLHSSLYSTGNYLGEANKGKDLAVKRKCKITETIKKWYALALPRYLCEFAEQLKLAEFREVLLLNK